MEINTDTVFDNEISERLDYASIEFGAKTADRWLEEYFSILHRLQLMPESYPFVPELQKWRKYRGAIVMKNFKIIYFYNEEQDVLWLVDLWDMRQNPRKLKLRAREIERNDYK